MKKEQLIKQDPNKIEIYPQNTLETTISLVIDKQLVPFVEGDTVVFSVYQTNIHDTTLIHKEITEFIDGKAFLELTPQDTDLNYGLYHYQVDCIIQGGKHYTIANSDFNIKGRKPYD